MPWTLILNFAKNPWVLLGVTIAGWWVYHNITVTMLENDLEKCQNNTERVEIARKKTEQNYNDVVELNEENEKEVENLEKDITILKQNQSLIVDSKNAEIKRLKNKIAEMKRPIIYPKEVVYEECKFEFLTKEDLNASDSTFRSISNIGH